MKAKILNTAGKEKKSIDLPKCFSTTIREDVVAKVLEAKKSEQPFAPSPVAGKQASAKGLMIHRRHVWKSQYGRGMSRVPRKVMSKRGSQFHWVGATSPNTPGGMRAHPPKVVSRIRTKSINKKEMKLALCSALSATGKGDLISKKYKRLNDKKIDSVPFVVDSKIISLKAKDLKSSIEKILGKDLFEIAIKKKDVRRGRGKRRGRKYKSNAGLLIVVGNEEKLKTKAFDVVPVKKLGVNHLANGGLGRLTLYTEKAIEDLKNKFGANKK